MPVNIQAHSEQLMTLLGIYDKCTVQRFCSTLEVHLKDHLASCLGLIKEKSHLFQQNPPGVFKLPGYTTSTPLLQRKHLIISPPSPSRSHQYTAASHDRQQGPMGQICAQHKPVCLSLHFPLPIRRGALRFNNSGGSKHHKLVNPRGCASNGELRGMYMCGSKKRCHSPLRIGFGGVGAKAGSVRQLRPNFSASTHSSPGLFGGQKKF